jgi:glutamate synthase (NADPH/NADH) small chain
MPERIDRKERMAIERQRMPQLDPVARASSFDEVNLGLPAHVAMLEARRCLDCETRKCVQGCPVLVNVPEFLEHAARGDFRSAAASLFRDNGLPAVTGRVCPQETQCEALCVRGRKGAPVAIGWIERFVADWARENRADVLSSPPGTTGKRMAVVGSGPGGLTAAAELARAGHEVTIFEALHEAGGVLVYGIPEFRLPKAIVRAEVDRLLRYGVRLELNAIVGSTYSLSELRERFDAVFLAVGAGLPVFLNIPGESLKGVYSANEYLTRVNLMGARCFPDADTPVLRSDRVAVVGGGNVALDAARAALRLGSRDVRIVYRRGPTEMPARAEELEHAREEGIRFEFLTAPDEVVGENGWVTGLRCRRMALGEPDASGRARPVPVPGSEHTLPCDLVVLAVGTRANPLLTSRCPELRRDPRGYIEIDEGGRTSLPGVFAGGDIVRGAATVILAMGDGKRAAAAMHELVRGPATGPAPQKAARPAPSPPRAGGGSLRAREGAPPPSASR